MNYYVGVDGGGTKTTVCIAAADSSLLLSELTGSASWREYGVNSVIGNIKAVIDGFPVEKDASIAGIVMGLPCFGEGEAGDRELKSAIAESFGNIPVYITNDVEVGWAGSLGLTPGVNVVAGTGSIAFGKNEAGETYRCGGWSEFFSDEGSCYWVGRKMLQLFSKQADGRMPRDELYDVVMREFGLTNDIEIIEPLHSNYLTSRDKVAALQFLAKEAALLGSVSARELYKKAADELCAHVAAIRNSLNFENEPFLVSYSGGLFKTGELILPHFFAGIEAICGKPVSPKFEPMFGALLMAFERGYAQGLDSLQKRLCDEFSA